MLDPIIEMSWLYAVKPSYMYLEHRESRHDRLTEKPSRPSWVDNLNDDEEARQSFRAYKSDTTVGGIMIEDYLVNFTKAAQRAGLLVPDSFEKIIITPNKTQADFIGIKNDEATIFEICMRPNTKNRAGVEALVNRVEDFKRIYRKVSAKFVFFNEYTQKGKRSGIQTWGRHDLSLYLFDRTDVFDVIEPVAQQVRATWKEQNTD